jgi:hypothetical protein
MDSVPRRATVRRAQLFVMNRRTGLLPIAVEGPFVQAIGLKRTGPSQRPRDQGGRGQTVARELPTK